LKFVALDSHRIQILRYPTKFAKIGQSAA